MARHHGVAATKVIRVSKCWFLAFLPHGFFGRAEESKEERRLTRRNNSMIKKLALVLGVAALVAGCHNSDSNRSGWGPGNSGGSDMQGNSGSSSSGSQSSNPSSSGSQGGTGSQGDTSSGSFGSTNNPSSSSGNP